MDSYRKQDTEENLLNKIVKALTGEVNIERSGSKESKKNFWVEETLVPVNIDVKVADVGKISFPIDNTHVQKLIAVSTTAKCKMGEKTVDKHVHNTQMIESNKFYVSINQESLSRITDHMEKELSLPANTTLTLTQHNMLICGPGQFCNQHRDSEELPNMFATLIIVLPSPHIGGDLIVEHGKNKYTFSTENVDEKNAKCICFFSDSVYEVNKVKCGYRVAITIDVIVETGEIVDTACTNEELKSAVRDYFNTTTEKKRSKKIVFFLNHTYSERSLRWKLLKGEDSQYAFSFRSVARELDLDIHLALSEIHQNWASSSEDIPDSDWLVESDSTLNNWVSANDVKLPYGKYSTTGREICFTRKTHYDNFEPTKKEFSVSTDNEGSTVDYWYKRGAIVLWQNSDSLMINFELNYDEALSELRTLVSTPGNEKRVMEILDKASMLLHGGGPDRDNFETFVNVALYVKRNEEAQTMLSPFPPDVLIPKNVSMFIQLQHLFGVDWLIELLGSLIKGRSYGYALASEAIDLFVRDFLNSAGDRSVVEFLVKAEVATFVENSYYRTQLERSRELFKACAAIENICLQEKLAQYLTSQPKLFPRSELVKLYCELQNTLSDESSENLELFRFHLEEGLKQELFSQTREADDWSISAVLSCNCVHCDILMNFLNSKTDNSKLWPATAMVRKHVTYILKRSKVPVDTTEQRGTKPFTLVLTKNATIHAEAAKKRNVLKTMLKSVKPKNVAWKRQSSAEKIDVKRQKP